MCNNGMWQHQMPQGKTERERQLELDLEQARLENLRREVADMNKEQEYWQQVRIDASINTASVCENMTKIQKELQKKGGQHE